MRTAIIHSTQRSPSEDELPWLASSPAELPRLADLGPLQTSLQLYIAQPNCNTAFSLDQRLWTHLAGNETRCWENHNNSQKSDDGPLYAPLDEGRNEIRVLKVSRPIQNGADAFQADLVCVSLDEDPAYLALSYAWGDTSVVGYFASHRGSQGRRIPYNKGIFDITNNILAPGTTLYLWIDALCINQEDLSERASQVAMMGTIFAQARQVIAFIGEADEISTTAMDFILRTVNCICAHGSISKSGTAPTLTTLLSEIGPAPRDCESIRGLISRRWFRRFWVVQEIALGNDPVLVCGKHSLQWCALELFIDLVYMAFESPESEHASFPICGDFLNVPRYLQNASAMLGARRGQRRDGLQPPFLFTLSSLSVTFESSDPRDRIYALLGLATAKKYRDVLLPNYEIRVEDLYVKGL
ncbi:heterokaryon incompatibility protein-domain-containing protein [Diaporthe sp. PMI_573]|nr:heterokaryon incompatibility protein-domain-containing protein [Diaporthaceae sp. PMI_573]